MKTSIARGLLVGLSVLSLLAAAAAPGLNDHAAAGSLGASPRAAMVEFLSACRRGDYATAARYLDLRTVAPELRGQNGPDLAWRLKSVLDRRIWIDVEALSGDPRGDLEDGLPADSEQVGSLELDGRPVALTLVHAKRSKADPAWRIASPTIASLAPLLAEVSWVEEHLPAVLVDTRILEMSLWQWTALPALAILSFVVATTLVRLARRPLTGLAGLLLADPVSLLDRIRAPARVLVGCALLLAALPTLGLAVPVRTASRSVVVVVAAAGLVWLLGRCLDETGRRAQSRMLAEGRIDSAGLIPTGVRIAKIVLAAIVFLVVAQNFGMNVTGLLAGLGVGGLAIALAAQKTVENLFGGVTLIADRPVQVGDFCRFGDRVGTIEAIGLRSTRVRTLDRTVVTVPNSEFSALQLETFAARDRIWLKLTLGLRYETTADQLRSVLEALRRILREDPRVDPDPARVRFVGFGAYSLDLELFAYIRTNDINAFLEIKEEILFAIMDAVEACGTGFAFPSQTIYQAKDSGLGPGRADDGPRAAAPRGRAGALPSV